jgi:hypothetical protein
MCGRLVEDPSTLQRRKPAGVPECEGCADFAAEARAEAKNTQTARRPRPPSPDEVDRRDRSRDRGTSMRAVSGGLPGLGHHQ